MEEVSDRDLVPSKHVERDPATEMTCGTVQGMAKTFSSSSVSRANATDAGFDLESLVRNCDLTDRRERYLGGCRRIGSFCEPVSCVVLGDV